MVAQKLATALKLTAEQGRLPIIVLYLLASLPKAGSIKSLLLAKF